MTTYLNGYHDELAENGMVLTPTDIRRAEASANAEIEAYRASKTALAPAGRLDKLNAALPPFQEAAHGISGAIMLALQTLLSAFGTPLILLQILIVEVQRVALGVALFDPHNAFLGATALVMLNLVLEFTVHYMEASAGYTRPDSFEFSIRFVVRRLAYILGIDKSPREKSPAHAFISYGNLLTAAILVIALLGSMNAVISATKGSWYTALQSIATDSSLETFSVWLSGILFAFVTVLGARLMTRYVAHRAAEVVKTTKHTDDSAIEDEIRHAAYTNVARAKIQQKKADFLASNSG